MDWEKEYASKIMSAEDILDRYVHDDMRFYCSGLHTPGGLIRPLCKRVMDGTLRGIDIWGNWMNGSYPYGDMPVAEDVFRYHTYFAGPNERAGMAAGCVAHVPVHFGDTEGLVAHYNPDYAFIQVTPPDKDGYCGIGPLGFTAACAPHCKGIIAQVNNCLPFVFGDCHKYHVSQITAFVLEDEPLEDIPAKDPSTEEKKTAEIIVNRVNDGDCIQVGIGGISDAIAQGLECKKHLGCYTEMYSDALARLQEKGVIDNSRRNYRPGVSIGGYSTGAKHLYDFIDKNPEVHYASYSEVCNPEFIRKNDNLISVNTAISIDLTGQVCAESIGPRQYSASGGQMNYVLGAKHSRGGKSFIAVTSVAHTKKGPVSKIAVTLAPGSAVTTLRNDVQFVVTEYGCAELRYADIPTRAKRLIAIAHPDFRDQLTFEAKKLGYLY